MNNEAVVGIDLGTTNSSIAIIQEGRPVVLKEDDDGLVPSCVGMDADGQMLVGRLARNQAVLFPERTVLSVKRRMGSEERIELGSSDYSPQQISAYILKELASRAARALGDEIYRAVITVPAYFTDAQRRATREAGSLAGLQVERIINEPTAASLAYDSDSGGTAQILVYDLGGGTFDVSVVAIEQGVVEVLATAGNNRLGGDDFDDLIVERLNRHLESKTRDGKLRDDRTVQARLRRAAEAAKKKLSSNPFALIEEDNLRGSGRRPLNLSYELSRRDFEEDIRDLLRGTLEEVTTALNGAAVRATDLDRVLLVGGSSRIPLVSKLLQERLGRMPHGEVDPDRCVALGAAIQAGVEAGEEVRSVLVDITPYTFGIEIAGDLDGLPSTNVFAPIIPRNSRLPVTKSNRFFALSPDQEVAEVNVYQGESRDTRKNTPIGAFLLEGLNRESNAYSDGVIVTYALNVDGILEISARERGTGKQISGRIEDALAARPDSDVVELPAGGGAERQADVHTQLLDRAEAARENAPDEDLEELERLVAALRSARRSRNRQLAEEVAGELAELLYFIE